MGKESPEPSKPYQGPQFGLQDSVLSNYTLGAFLGSQPGLARSLNIPTSNVGSNWTGGFNQGQSANQGPLGNPGSLRTSQTIKPDGGFGFGAGGGLRGGGGLGDSVANKLYNLNQSQNQQNPIPLIPQQGFTQAGQNINGQLMPFVDSNTNAPGYNFYDPGANFARHNPYYFSQTPSINVADTYTPQMALASRDIIEQGKRSQDELMSNMNQRGMLTTGAATKEMQLQQQEQNRKLADLSSQYSIAQGQAQLQEDQMRRQMEQQRQLSQAEELFRQQGATDEQAKFLASQNVNLQQAQAGQNLNAYNATLAGRNQAFTQALQGRQQATSEEQLASLMRRQPLEYLYRMWAQQAGSTGPTEGSPGIMGVLGSLVGSFAGKGLGKSLSGSSSSSYNGGYSLGNYSQYLH